MKIPLYDLPNYAVGIPAEDGENTQAYAVRLRKTLVDEWGLKAGVDFDDEDIDALVNLALKANPQMPRGTTATTAATGGVGGPPVVGGPPPVVPVPQVKAKPVVSSGAAKLIAKREAEVSEKKDARVYFDASFRKHLFEGEPDGNAHKGLHHMPGVLNSGKPPTSVTRESDAKTGTYVADVTFPGKQSKASSFFPDDWSQSDVMSKIEEAVRWSWVNPTESATQARMGGLKWAGYATIGGGVLLIGGLGGKGDSPGEAIVTAFPAVNGRFFKL